MTTYEKVIAAGLEHDSHSSDLYVKETPEACVIVAEHEFASNVTRFRSQVDRCVWFDIPFAYDPWWAARQSHK